MKHRGKHSLVYFDGEKEIFLPLLNEKNEVETFTTHLSNWDYMTMHFKDRNALFSYYQSLGVLTGTQASNSRFYIRTNESNKIGIRPLDVAYEDDLLLGEALLRDKNQVDENSFYVSKFLKRFFFDIKKKEPFLKDLISPIRKGISKEYIDSFLVDRLKYLLYAKGDSPSDELAVIEEKERRMKQMNRYLLDSYPRFRGLYFFHKDLKSDRLKTLQLDILTERMLETYLDYGNIDPNNPYVWKDPFDRPEDEVEYVLPENPDEGKSYKRGK